MVLNELGQEQVIGGKGIAFGKKIGDEVNQEIVNKTFVLPIKDSERIYHKYLESIPVEYFEVANDILKLATDKLEIPINENVVLSISDHIFSAIERYKRNNGVNSHIIWEIKNFYNKEYEIGIEALDLIETKLGIKLPIEEAGFIATHIIDAELKTSDLNQVYKTTELIKDINNIVKYYFNIDFDVESVYYYRFITHLKFFAKRLFTKEMYNVSTDDKLYGLIKENYENSYKCALKISEYILNKYGYTLSKEELVYITIHLENLIYKSKKEN